MPTFTTHALSVRQLFVWFDECRFAVPEIQREFVWNAQRACSLLDSIYKGYPVGTAMVWKTGKANTHLLRHQLHILPAFDPMRNKEVNFLIDGQQRLSVIYQVRRGEPIYNSLGRLVPFDQICLSIENGEAEFTVIKPRRRDSSIHFPVHHILADTWYRHVNHLPASKRKRVKDCRTRLMSYKMPFIFLSACELSDVRETFIRINTQGMTMSESDRAFSVASKVKPLHRYRQLCGNLSSGFQGLQKQTYWMTLTLIRGVADVGQRAIERLTREIQDDDEGQAWFEKQEPLTAECIRLACDHLSNSLAVPSIRDLPYEPMIAMLALFFHSNNSRQPNPIQKRQIRAWFWHTAVVKRYAGSGWRRNLLADADFFRRLGESRTGRYDASEKASASSLVSEDYRGSSALSAAFRLLLASQAPCYLDNGEPIPLGQTASARNSKELHHIWPRELLKRHRIPATRFNSICNICFLAAQDNRSFGARHPLSYLEAYWSRKHFARVMNSHLIPYRDSSPLWDENVGHGFKKFVQERQKLVEKAFNEAAGIKLFDS
jgi:hypothetical protein